VPPKLRERRKVEAVVVSQELQAGSALSGDRSRRVTVVIIERNDHTMLHAVPEESENDLGGAIEIAIDVC
jgi:hypothetical protein